MDYTRKYWEDGVTDDNALAMNNIELGIDNAKTEINSMNNIVKKEKSLILWRQVVADNLLSKMIMETLLDNSNINLASTGYIYDSYCLMTASTADVTFNEYLNDVVPTQVYVSADCVLGTGGIVFSISRDGGVTFTECPLDTLVDISAQPSGRSIVLRAIITGAAILNAAGYGWK